MKMRIFSEGSGEWISVCGMMGRKIRNYIHWYQKRGVVLHRVSDSR
jgi:predicted phosphoadenosine phosphosulfate sulfurtransferase